MICRSHFPVYHFRRNLRLRRSVYPFFPLLSFLILRFFGHHIVLKLLIRHRLLIQSQKKLSHIGKPFLRQHSHPLFDGITLLLRNIYAIQPCQRHCFVCHQPLGCLLRHNTGYHIIHNNTNAVYICPWTNFSLCPVLLLRCISTLIHNSDRLISLCHPSG